MVVVAVLAATQPLPRDGSVEELHGNPTVGHAPRSRPEVKNGISSTKDGAPERFRCGLIKKVSWILQRVFAGAARRFLLRFYPAQIRGRGKAVTVAATSRQFTAGETGKGQFFRRNRRNLAEEGVVRIISSPRRVAGAPNLCSDRAQ